MLLPVQLHRLLDSISKLSAAALLLLLTLNLPTIGHCAVICTSVNESSKYSTETRTFLLVCSKYFSPALLCWCRAASSYLQLRPSLLRSSHVYECAWFQVALHPPGPQTLLAPLYVTGGRWLAKSITFNSISGMNNWWLSGRVFVFTLELKALWCQLSRLRSDKRETDTWCVCVYGKHLGTFFLSLSLL